MRKGKTARKERQKRAYSRLRRRIDGARDLFQNTPWAGWLTLVQLERMEREAERLYKKLGGAA